VRLLIFSGAMVAVTVMAHSVVAHGRVTASQAAASARPHSEQQRLERHEKQKRLFESGLRGAASMTGSVSVRRPVMTDSSVLSLDQLVHSSDVIVVGPTVRNRAWLTEDGRSIRSVFTVQVDSTLKINGRAHSLVQVIIPGGRFGFPEGTWAQENTPGFLWPSQSQNYIWFLRRATRQEGALFGNNQARFAVTADVYVPVAGPVGVIWLTHPSGIVRPSGGYENAFARSLVVSRVTSAVFMEDVRASLIR
jgi:hypothetical protein